MTRTALDQYAKLEAEARYLDGSGGPALDVILSFGARSLMIVGLDDRAIAHWPLASLVALSPPEAEILELAPDRDSPERLELTDALMVEAIGAVCAELHELPEPEAEQQPRRRWPLRVLILVLAIAAAAIAIGRNVDMDAAVASFVDPADADDIGARQIVLLARSMGDGTPVARCTDAEGVAALGRVLARVAPAVAADARVLLLDHPAADALSLPGGRIVLTRGLLAAAASPEEIAGVLAVEAAHVAAGLPLAQAVGALGAGQKAALVFGAGLDDEAHAAVLVRFLAPGRDSAAAALEGIATLDRSGLPRAPFETLLRDLATLGKPYAARRPTVLAAFDGRPTGGLEPGQPYEPALDDRDWLALANICDVRQPVR